MIFWVANQNKDKEQTANVKNNDQLTDSDFALIGISSDKRYFVGKFWVDLIGGCLLLTYFCNFNKIKIASL